MDKQKITDAINSKKVGHCKRDELAVKFTAICDLMDIDYPQNRDLLINFVMTYYTYLGIEEIPLAFELMLAGRFEIRQQKFGLKYITDTFNGYIKYKRVEHKPDYKEIKRTDYTEEEKYNIVRSGLLEKREQWNKNHNVIVWTFYYDWCRDNNIEMIVGKTAQDYIDEGRTEFRREHIRGSTFQAMLLEAEKKQEAGHVVEAKRIYLQDWFSKEIIIPEFKN